MRNVYLRSFLAIIILLQSLAVVADAHQFHQSTDQHDVLAEHSHEQGAVLELSDNPPADSLDCHHCCHCHSSGGSALPMSAAYVGLVKYSSLIFMYTDQYVYQPSGSLYRPPII